MELVFKQTQLQLRGRTDSCPRTAYRRYGQEMSGIPSSSQDDDDSLTDAKRVAAL
jgi:hypothetical protein